MTKKKQRKSEVRDKVNISEIADNKDIDSQNDDKLKDKKDSDDKKPDGIAIQEELQVMEAEGGKAPDKDASEENLFELKLAEMQDRYLRLSAEFDNYRKRTLREKI